MTSSLATPHGADRKRGLVISDLHLFSRRSNGEEKFNSIRSDIENVSALVFNGDTFDFRWSHFPTKEESISHAIRWLKLLLDNLRDDQQLYFLHGNHDCITGFTETLDALAIENEKLVIEERVLILGRNLFLHGDGANWQMDSAALDRFRDQWSRDQPQGKLASLAYNTIDATGLSRAFHEIYFPTRRTIHRIAFHLDHVHPQWRNKTDAVYFGHTHRPFANVEHDGIRFFNTGSGIRKMGFSPQYFEFEMD